MDNNNFILFTASYFVNWSYQTSKACTVLVGESTEMFPASKATTLESSNKSLARPHQSSSSSGSGNEDYGPHSRPRRSVDGHASVSPSVSSMDSSLAVDMHELITTPPVSTVSLVHGVTSASDDVTQPKEGDGPNAAFVSSSVNDLPVKTDLINSGKLETPSHNTEITEETTLITIKAEGDIKSNNTNTMSESVSTTINVEPVIEDLPEIPPTKIESIDKKDDSKIAYDPESMQGDSYPSLYSYGIQKLQYLKLLTRLNAVLPVESVDREKELNRLHYVSDNNSNKVNTTTETTTTTTTHNMSTEPITTTAASTIPKEPTLNESVITSTPILMTTYIPHDVASTQSAPSVTNPNLAVNNTTTTTERTEDFATVNIATESRTPDVSSNPKHVLINLTISADDADSTLYKPLYSLTVTVPTVGDSNEIPTVKITPMDVEPTAPTNFNNPVKIESSTKVNAPTNTDPVWGGSCECSCPVCGDDNVTDDFYSDYSETSTTETPENDSTTDINPSITENENTSSTNSNIEKEITEMNTESTTGNFITTDVTDITTDYTTESDVDISSTVLPKCECPQVQCPPILILEGEVVGFEFNQR